MAFLIYKKYGNAETIRYEKLQPLKLGGRDGLIAKHVKTLTGDQMRSWKLGASTLLKLAGFAGAVDELAVLFDVTGKDATNVCLYELSRIPADVRTLPRSSRWISQSLWTRKLAMTRRPM